MKTDDIVITDENREEVLQKIYNNPVFQGGVSDWETFIRHKKVRAAYKEMKNPDAVVKAFAFNPPLSESEASISVPGFYLQHRQFRSYNEDEEEWELDAEGPMVLAADGVVLRTRRSSTRSPVRTVTSGQNLDDEVDGVLTEARVMVGPVLARKNLVSGVTTAKIIDETKVEVADHESEVPAVGIEEHIERCLGVATRGEPDRTPFSGGGDARHVIYGDTGKTQVFGVLTLGDEEEIDFEYGNESLVKAVGYDHANLKARPKIDTSQVVETFGLPEEPDVDIVKESLRGEPVAWMGKFGIGYPIDVTEDRLDGEAELEACLNDIEAYVENDWMVKREDSDGHELLAIDLESEVDEDEQGNPIPASVPVGGYDAYDLYQEMKGGKPVWQIWVLSTDEGGQPWIDAREHHFKYKKDIESMGVEKGDPGVTNEGAFLLFLNHTGAGVRLRDDDPFAGKFSDLPGFEDLDEELDAEDDADDEEQAESDEDAEEEAEATPGSGVPL